MKKAALTILILATFNYLYSNQTNKDMSNIGKSNPSYKHGESHKTKEYSIWCGIRKRCLNTKSHNYSLYGGRGIKICERWESYENFLYDMGRCPSPTHSIERIENDKGYYPENCKWATPTEQAKNRRRTRHISFNGETKCLKDWAKSIGINQSSLRERFEYGWSIERALTTPRRKMVFKA